MSSLRQSVSDSDDSANAEFQKIVDGFLLQPGLSFSSVLTAEKIDRIASFVSDADCSFLMIAQ